MIKPSLFLEKFVFGASFKLGLVLFGLLTTSCAARTGAYPQNTPGNFLYSEASLVAMDSELEKSSQAYHHYLLGQILFSQEKTEEAAKNLSKASELLGSAGSSVHSELARIYLRSGESEKALQASSRAIKADPDDTELMMMHAGILESLERYKEAEPIYLSIIEKQPDLSDTYILLSNLYLQTDRFEKGEALLLDLIEKKPEDPSAIYFLGRAYESEERFEQADLRLKQAMELQPSNKNLMLDRIRVLLKGGQKHQAKELCEAILRDNPENEPVRRILGHILLGENKFDEAVGHLEILGSVQENPTETRLQLALIHMQRGNNADAIRELTLLLARESDHGQARYYLATLYAGSNREKEALEVLEKIEEGQLIFAQARNLEAFILRQQGKLAEAEASLLAAYEADSQNVQVLAHLASVMREAEKYTDLKLILEEALLEHPENEQVLFNYGVVLHDLAQNENSILAMREVVALNPENADALNFIAYTLAEEKRDLDEALKLVQKALEIDPENGYYLDTLGWIQYQSGDYEAARKNLAKAVELSENDVVIMVHYADSLLKTGEESKAIEMYEAALRVANHETTNADEKKSIERATQQLEELAPNSKLANKQ